MDEDIKSALERYLSKADQFQLGHLITEMPHPKTTQLSSLAQNDILSGIAALKSIDVEALSVLLEKQADIQSLAKTIHETLRQGQRVFLCGCGATGRLSLSLEVLWREQGVLAEQVIAFMAGGDFALIKSVESFEDMPHYGAKQLLELGFGEGDLLIACTEGGETSFVIGAVMQALKSSQVSPVFVYCNPDTHLQSIERSFEVLQNKAVTKMNLTVGPMALSGSTRMQASTVQMLAVGLALFCHDTPNAIGDQLNQLIDFMQQHRFDFLANYIEKEAAHYHGAQYVLYESDADNAITVLTDTTERSPTFSLQPFESRLDPRKRLSWCYLSIPTATDAPMAWQQLLKRQPRALEWSDLPSKVGLEHVYGFDFSRSALANRQRFAPDALHEVFKVSIFQGELRLSFQGLEEAVVMRHLSRLLQTIVLKCLLNMHSTLVMGRLGRFENNIMTYARASNYKLIDRSIRYAAHLLKQSDIEVSYADVAKACFKAMRSTSSDDPLVLAVVNQLKRSQSHGHTQ